MRMGEVLECDFGGGREKGRESERHLRQAAESDPMRYSTLRALHLSAIATSADKCSRLRGPCRLRTGTTFRDRRTQLAATISPRTNGRQTALIAFWY